MPVPAVATSQPSGQPPISLRSKILPVFPPGGMVEVIEVQQPSGAITPATASLSNWAGITSPSGVGAATSQPSGQATASTGHTQIRDYAAEKQSQTLTWAGIALVAIGTLSLFFRSYFPIIPIGASVAAIALGIVFLSLPGIIGEYGWLIGIGAVGVVFLVSYFDNKNKLKGTT